MKQRMAIMLASLSSFWSSWWAQSKLDLVDVVSSVSDHAETRSPSSSIATVSRALQELHSVEAHASDPAKASAPSSAVTATERKRKTLVLDLDETLIHSSSSAQDIAVDFTIDVEIEGYRCLMYVSKRPHLEHFLTEAAKHFELVVFTASLKPYADMVIEHIDPQRLITRRYFRNSCDPLPQGGFVKNLTIVEPDLKSVMIIDNSPIAYSWHRDNAIPISDWWGTQSNTNDTALLDLVPFLEALKSVEDVRSILSLKDQPSF
jgi:RNA polymerase II subunit A small phosphatase-like protein/CTD nuclear envelope phosphatase 1